MSNIKLTFIGSGDAFGSGNRYQTCMYVETSMVRFLIDCGATAVFNLKKNDIRTSDIDIIFITHFHGDHYGGVPFLLLDARFIEKRTRPLTIVSPPGGKEKITALVELLYPGSSLLETFPVHFIEYEDQFFSLYDLKVLAKPVIHTPESNPYGLRIEIQDKTIAYSGDSGWTEVLTELSFNADLFVTECCFLQRNLDGHLNYSLLKEKRSQLTAKKIILTHMEPEVIQAENILFQRAEDNLSITL